MNQVVLAQMMGGGEGPSAFGPMIMMGVIFAIFYLLIFRPQFKQERQKDDFRNKLKKGDEVLAAGGLYGKVADIKGNVVLVDLAPNVRVRAEKKTLEPLPRPAKSDDKEASAT